MTLKSFSYVLLVILILGSCYKPVPKIKTFNNFIIQSVKGDSCMLDISNYKDFPWDHFYIITAYTGKDYFTGELKPYKGIVEETGIDMRDDKQLFVFFNKSTLVGYENVWGIYMFGASYEMNISTPHLFKRSGAKFFCKEAALYKEYLIFPLVKPINNLKTD